MWLPFSPRCAILDLTFIGSITPPPKVAGYDKMIACNERSSEAQAEQEAMVGLLALLLRRPAVGLLVGGTVLGALMALQA